MPTMQCLHCGARLKHGDNDAGKRAKCSQCGNGVIVPGPVNMLQADCPMCGAEFAFDVSQRGQSGQCPRCGEPITVSMPSSKSEPTPGGRFSWRRLAAFVSIILMLIVATWGFNSDAWLAWKLGNAAIVGLCTLPWFAVRGPRPKWDRPLLWGFIAFGCVVAWYFSSKATYNVRTELEHGWKVTTYDRRRRPIEQTISIESDGWKIFAYGPLSESGKPHGEWRINGRSQWYWYDEECTEGEFRRWDKK